MTTLYWKDVNGRNWPVCSCLKAWLPVYQTELLRLGVIREGLDLYQTIGGAAASGGTHSTGQCADTGQRTYTAIWVARQMGADASWNRPYNWDNAGGMAHAHLNLRGCPHGSAAADRQYSSTYQGVDYGKNGLANGAADTGPRPLSKRTWQQGITWAKARQTAPAPAKTTYYVKAAFALGHETPSATARRVGSLKIWGTPLGVSKTQTVNGALWAWVDTDSIEGRWYLVDNLSLKPPTTKIQKIGTLSIGEYNTAAQASGHASTYPTRAPLSAKRMVDSGADIIHVVEYGSSSTTLSGKTFLQISDDARKAASAGNLVRIPHGEKWRHLLRRLDTTDYVADSGQSWTLPTHVDTDGTQIVAAAIVKKGVDVKCGHVCFHLDVNSTAAQLKAQAIDTLRIGETWRIAQGIQPWNMVYAGDHNDTGSTVRGVFATHGFVSASTQPGAVGGECRTTNSWANSLTTGPQRDATFVWEGSAEGWQQWLDAVAADHNYNVALRAIYGSAS